MRRKSFSETIRLWHFAGFLLLLSGILTIFLYQKNVLASPLVAARSTLWDTILKKLDAVPNTFTLHSPVSFVPAAQAAADYENASSYIAIDETTGTIILEKNSHASFPIASLTKMMSSLVALDLAKPEDELTISQQAPTVEPTTIGVIPGQHMTVSELLHGMLMTSANDAAQATADGINQKYNADIFVKAMNAKAQFLGLQETHFANPQGFDDPENYSSAHDLAILASYALTHYPLFAHIVSEDYQQLPVSTFHKQFDLYNWNGLLDVYPGVTGVKIGNTADAGYTTVVSSTRDGHTILVVLLGAPGILQRDLWTSQLLDDAFANAFHLPPVGVTVSELEAKYQSWHYWN